MVDAGREPTALHFLILTVAGWMNRRQVDAIAYLIEENRILREHVGRRRLRFTDAQRRRLAERGARLGRKRLEALASIVTPETILRWYRRLIAHIVPLGVSHLRHVLHEYLEHDHHERQGVVLS